MVSHEGYSRLPPRDDEFIEVNRSGAATSHFEDGHLTAAEVAVTWRQDILRTDFDWMVHSLTGLATEGEISILETWHISWRSVGTKFLASSTRNTAAAALHVLGRTTSIVHERVVEILAAVLRELASIEFTADAMHQEAILDAGAGYAALLAVLNRGISSVHGRLAITSTTARMLAVGAVSARSTSEEARLNVSVRMFALRGLLTILISEMGAENRPPRSVTTTNANSLAWILREDSHRGTFIENEPRGFECLLRCFSEARGARDIQLAYEIGVCWWLLSLNDRARAAIVSDKCIGRLLAMLVDLARTGSKEKLVRICLATLLELAEGCGKCRLERSAAVQDVHVMPLSVQHTSRGIGVTPSSFVYEELVELDLRDVLDLVRDQPFKDEELINLVYNLDKGLAHHFRKMTSFERYRLQVNSRRLSWGAMRKDQRFWRANVMCFEESSFMIVKALATLAADKEGDAEVTAVALHDLACFMEHYPQGRQIVSDIPGFKKRAIELMELSTNSQIQRHALSVVQRLMLANNHMLPPQHFSS